MHPTVPNVKSNLFPAAAVRNDGGDEQSKAQASSTGENALPPKEISPETRQNNALISRKRNDSAKLKLGLNIPTSGLSLPAAESASGSLKKPRLILGGGGLRLNIENKSCFFGFGASANITTKTTQVAGALYSEIPLNPNTQVGKTHANRISVNNKAIGIATQFPKNEQLPEFIKSLFDEGSILVVLASKGDLDSENYNAMLRRREPKISAYFDFDSEKTHGDYKLSRISLGESTVGEYKANKYSLRITSTKDNQTRDVPVLHISDWADKSIPQKPETLLSVIETVNNLEKQSKGGSSTSDANERSPVVHCLAGQSRTGIVMAARTMQQNPEMTLDEIVSKMRECRPEMMKHEENNLLEETKELFRSFAGLLKPQG